MRALNLQVPEEHRPFLRLGTCSWKYDSWKGIIYRDEVDYGAFDYLPEYARAFNTVEVDQGFVRGRIEQLLVVARVRLELFQDEVLRAALLEGLGLCSGGKLGRLRPVDNNSLGIAVAQDAQHDGPAGRGRCPPHDLDFCH